MEYFDPDIKTEYISNITGKFPTSQFSMFKAQTSKGDTCERVCIHGRNGLVFNSSRLGGFYIGAEDPRLVECKGKTYVIFNCFSPYEGTRRCMAITPFEEFNPVYLRPLNFIEKNWAPFVKDDNIYFVYNFEPLIILKYDMNPEGLCDIVYGSLPFNIEPTYLRGGSNLIPYKDKYYIGGCHSRIQKDGIFYHFTHIVVIDPEIWKVIHISKPVWFNYDGTDAQSYQGGIYDIHPNCIQDPISIYDNYMTINVRDCVSLLYKIEYNIDKFTVPDDIQEFTRLHSEEISHLRNGSDCF